MNVSGPGGLPSVPPPATAYAPVTRPAPGGGRLRAGALIAAGAVLVVAGALGVATFRSVRWQLSTLHPARSHVTPSAAHALGEVIDVSFPTEDGLTLRGWYHPSKNGAAIVLTHGWGGNREHLLPEGATLAQAGYGVLLFDLRAHGESDGDLSTWGDFEKRDVSAAVDFLSQRADVDSSRIGGVGFSMGGAAMIGEVATDPRIKAMVIEATAPTLAISIHENAGPFRAVTSAPARWAMGRQIDIEAVRPVDEVCAFAPRPVLFVNGDDGNDQPEQFSRDLFAAACGPKDYWHVQGAGHGEYAKVAPAELSRRLLAFFDRPLAGSPDRREPGVASP